MIPIAPSAAPLGLPEAAQSELDQNVRKVAAGAAPAFNAFKRPGVRDSLNNAFFYKCAYCESSIAPTQPVAIEHYRPKAKVVLGKGQERPGYYWLAGEWTNLLPSCTDCNSQRNYPGLDNGPLQLLGKGNLFPIANERMRATKPGEERRERRLLLHPYLDDPEKHLEFIEDGIVRPRKWKTRLSPQGRTSIFVYALLRPKLVDARAEEQLLLRTQIARVRREIAGYESNPTGVQEAYMRGEIEALKAFVTPKHRYAGMARQTIKAEAPDLAAIVGLTGGA